MIDALLNLGLGVDGVNGFTVVAVIFPDFVVNGIERAVGKVDVVEVFQMRPDALIARMPESLFLLYINIDSGCHAHY